MYLVSGLRSGVCGTSAVCPSARQAIDQIRDFRGLGYATTVLDARGREVPISHLFVEAAKDQRSANSGTEDRTIGPVPI